MGVQTDYEQEFRGHFADPQIQRVHSIGKHGLKRMICNSPNGQLTRAEAGRGVF